MTPSRTPEGPLNFCPVCGQHCRLEPSLLTLDAVCPHCGSLLWFDSARQKRMKSSQEQMCHEVNRPAEEIAQLSKKNLAPTNYYSEFFLRVLLCLAAPAGAVWKRIAKDGLLLQYHINWRQVAVDLEGVNGQMHDELLRQAIQKAKPGLFHPKSNLGSPDAKTPVGNPTGYVILLAPILVEGELVGLIEVWQDPHRGADAQRGFLQFMMKMAGLAADYERKSVAG